MHYRQVVCLRYRHLHLLGVDPQLYLHLGRKIKESGKLQALDFVEYLPSRDHDDLCARVAARFIWEFTRGL